MTIKPVLVPDHDAAALRGLIDRFADATTGPVKRQLTESVESGVTEGVKKMSPQQQHDFDRMRYGAMSRKEYDAKWKKPLKSDDEVIYGKKKSVAEFAPPDSGDGGGDDDGFDEDTLRKLAAQWFNGDEDPQVERLLAAAGWEIGQDEGYDDEPGVFVVLSGDDDGRSYMSWPAEELRSDVAEARPDVEEGINEDLSPEIKKLNKTYKKLFSIIAYDKNGKKLMSGPKAHKEVSRQLGVDPSDMDEYLRLEYYDFFDTVNKEWDKQKGNRKEHYSNEIYGKVDEDPTKIKEARPDVMRHGGDKTVRVVKKGGKPVGEIGIDAGPGGNGDYYVKLYDGTYDAAGFDTAEEALEELRYAVKQMSEGPETGIGSKLPKSDIETFGLQKGRPYKLNPPQDWKPGDRKRAVQQLIPTQDKKDHIRSRLGKHVAPALPESDAAQDKDLSEKLGALRPKLGTGRDIGKSVRNWRKQRGLSESNTQDKTDPNFFRKFSNLIAEAEQQVNEVSRRGFLKGLAGFAANASVPAPVVKMLSTPAGVSGLTVAAGLALLKGVQDHLDQFDAEDDDDYIDAQEDMASQLGFEGDDEEGIYATDQMTDLLDLYSENPNKAAEQLIQHIQSRAIDPADVKASFQSRADDPTDWRYHDRKDSSTAADAASMPTPGLGTTAAGIANKAASSTGNAVKQLPKAAAALPAPTKPEFEIPANQKSKVKVPVEQDKEGVSEDSYKDNRGTFVDRIVGEIMNYQSLNDTNPKFADLSSAVKSKLKSLGEIKAKQIYQQALKQAAELSGQQDVAEGSENNPVVNAITRRIMLQRTDLLSKYGPEKVGQAIDEVADFVGDVEEIGSSDVSGWVRHVEQMLGNMESDVAEQQVDELSPKTLGSYIKKSSADAAERQGEVSGRNQFGKGAEFAVKAFYGDRIQPNPTRTDPRIAKRQAGVDQAVDRLTAEDVAPAFKPGDRVMYLNGFATVVAQDGDAYGIRIDGKPGTQMVPADQIRKPSYDESVAESIDPVEQLRADIRRFAL